MNCTSCGAVLPDGTSFCTSCGAKVITQTPVQPAPAPAPVQQYAAPAPVQQPVYQAPPVQQVVYAQPMPDTTPLSPWAYILYMLLFSVPILNIIMILIFSFGKSTNMNLKNFAKAYLIIMVVGLIFGVIVGGCTAITGVGLFSGIMGELGNM